MAETIRGINVVIGAETTGLSKALSDVNTKSKNIQTELKQVEKLLKLDPTNTDLLAQKQKLLGDAVANTREKLDRLRTAQEQVNAQFARGEISEGQYRAFQREIAKTEQELQSFENRLKQTAESVKSFADKVKEAGDGIKESGAKISGVGESLSAGLTAPLVAVGIAAGKTAADVDAAAGKIQARLGITSQEADKLSKSALGIWENGFGESLEQVNGALAITGQNIQDLDEASLSQLTQSALTLQQVFEADVNETTRTASVLMKNFGIDGQDAMDLMTVGFQKGGDFSGELLDTLREYAPQFAALGLSADDMLGILIKGAESGAFNLDKVGDSIKELGIRVIDQSKTTAEGFSLIGLDADKMSKAFAAGGDTAKGAFQATVAALASMKDPIAQNTAGVNLFGTQWEDVKKNVVLAMTDGIGSITEFQGATEKAAQAVQDNFGTDVTKIWRQLQADLIPLGKTMLDIAQNTLRPFIAGIQQLANWFSNLSPSAQTTVFAIMGVVAAIGPALIIIGQLVTAVGAIITGFSAVSGAIAAAGGVMAILTGPVGIAIAAVAALAAAAYLIYDNWEPIKQFFIDIWSNITSATATAWEGIKQFFSATWEWIQNFFAEWGTVILAVIAPFIGIPLLIQQHWDEILPYLTALWESVKQVASNSWNLIVSAVMAIVSPFVDGVMAIFNSMRSGLTQIWDGLKMYFGGVWEVIKNIFLGAVLLIYDLVTGNFSQLSADAQMIWTNLQEAFAQIWEGIKLVFCGALDAISGYLVLIWDTIKSTTETVWNGILLFFSITWEGMKSLNALAMSAMRTAIETAWNAIKTFFTDAWNKIKWLFTDGLNNAKETVVSGMKQIKSDFISYMNDTVNEIKEFAEDFVEAGEDFVISLWDGIKSKSSWLWKQIKGWIDGLISQIRGALSGGSGGSGGNNTGDSSMSGAGSGGATAASFSAPGLKDGGTVTRSGWTWVGENGPELLGLPQASQVIPNYDIPKIGGQEIDYDRLAKAIAANSKPNVTMNNTFNSPMPLSPAETARKNLQVSRQLAMEWGM